MCTDDDGLRSFERERDSRVHSCSFERNERDGCAFEADATLVRPGLDRSRGKRDPMIVLCKKDPTICAERFYNLSRDTTYFFVLYRIDRSFDPVLYLIDNLSSYVSNLSMYFPPWEVTRLRSMSSRVTSPISPSAMVVDTFSILPDVASRYVRFRIARDRALAIPTSMNVGARSVGRVSSFL